MSIDANVLNFLIPDSHFIWVSPLLIGFTIFLLYIQVGYSAFAGLGVMLLMLPINIVVFKKMSFYQNKVMENKGTFLYIYFYLFFLFFLFLFIFFIYLFLFFIFIYLFLFLNFYLDKRIKLINEIIQGIRIIKFFTWEDSYSKRVNEVRKTELVTLKSVAYIQAFSNFAWTSIPLLVSLVTFVVYSLSGNVLTAEVAFTSLSLFNLLRIPLFTIPEVIKEIVEATISLKRIQKYLLNGFFFIFKFNFFCLLEN